MRPSEAPQHAQLIVLSLLQGGPQYGYALSKEAAARTDNQFRLTPGVLYPILKQLETEGLIAAEWEEVKSERAHDAAEGRKRKWYRLTPKGRRRLAQQVEAHNAWRALVDLFIRPRSDRSSQEAQR